MSVLWCVLYGVGIIGCLVIHGVLQERVVSSQVDSEHFVMLVFLDFCNRILAVLFAFCLITLKKEGLINTVPFWKYLAISFSSIAASICQFEALRYVSFSVQVLGKSFNMMPVMLWGIAISRQRYSFHDWLGVIAVTGGVTGFLLSSDVSPKHQTGHSSYGLVLLVAFLVLDGFTSTFQEKLFREYKTSTLNQMLHVNLGSALVLSFIMIASGTLISVPSFFILHPAAAHDALCVSASAVGGQWFMFSQVKEFGALVFAATVNVRQMVSILISCAIDGHSINLSQVVGLFLVFTTLFLKTYKSLVAKSQEHIPLTANDKFVRSVAGP